MSETRRANDTGSRGDIVFGASGFIGSHLAEQLQHAGNISGRRVTTPVRSQNTFLASLGCPQPRPDFSDDAALIRCIEGHERVYGCLANPRRHLPLSALREVEVELSCRLIRAAAKAGAQRFILLSTVMVYGFSRPPQPIDETWPPQPEHPFCRVALEREQAARATADAAGIELVILRPATTLGQRDRQMAPLFSAFRRGFFPVFGHGHWRFSAIDARDLGRALAFLGTLPEAAGQTWLARGYDTDWLCLKQTLEQITGHPARKLPMPLPLARLLGGLSDALCPWRFEPSLTRFSVDVMSTDTLFNDHKLRAAGWSPEYGLADTLQKIIGADVA